VVDIGSGSGSSVPRKRADARRNEETLLDAAAAAFVTSGVDVPVRDIAAKAGVGVGTIYRHFPTRADLIVAVYRHQVEACAEAGPALLANSSTPHAALAQWINLFVDFLVTKHGLAGALQSDKAAFETLHAYFLDRLVPVCAQLLDAAATAGEIPPGTDAYELMLGVGNLCIGADSNPRYDARHMVGLVIAGLRSFRVLQETSQFLDCQATSTVRVSSSGAPNSAIRPSSLAQVRNRSLSCIVLAVSPHPRTQLCVSAPDTVLVLLDGVRNVDSPGHRR
jgi:AcrR family transcriptional regulator